MKIVKFIIMMMLTQSCFGDTLTTLDSITNPKLTFSSTSGKINSVNQNIPKNKITIKKDSGQLFYPLNAQLTVIVSDAKLDKKVTNNIIQLNDIQISSNQIVYDFTSNSFVITTKLEDGKNSFSFTLRDENGKIISAEEEVYAGSKNVLVNLSRQTGDVQKISKISLIPTDNSTAIFDIDTTKDHYEIKDVPNLDFQIKKFTSEFIGDSVLFKDDVSIDLISENFGKAVADTNPNFKNGITGWTIKGADYSIGENGITLSPDKHGVGVLHKVFKSGYSNKSINFSYSIVTKKFNEYYSIYVWNKTTGDMDYEFKGTHELHQDDSQTPQTIDLQKSTWSTSTSDIIEIEFRLFEKSIHHNDKK